jgi:hypothetical protein
MEYGMKQAALYRDIAQRAAITKTEVRRGRGKGRRRVVEEEDIVMSRGNGDDPSENEEDEVRFDDDEEELDDWRGDASDEDHVLGGRGGRRRIRSGMEVIEVRSTP